ncbi:MAG: zeta toxin family protein [Candidatus Wallbacteria bacterium]|nr:zeta toxin family protein [Candidatus Wallbacteria bacterium]
MKKIEIRKKSPSLFVIAGPNGSGKTTFAMTFLPEIATVNFINADLIAGGLSPLMPSTAAIEAGKLFLKKIVGHAEKRENFAFETTLAGLTHVRFLRKLKKMNYRIYLIFLWISSPELALKRVADRVRRGGHDIPEKDLRRRYHRGISNFFKVYLELCDTAVVFDNSGSNPRMIAVHAGKNNVIIDDEVYRSMTSGEMK